MELKVFKESAAAYGGQWETRLELPVETEILIPDYQPAVFKIVKCLLEPAALQNRVEGGRFRLEGYIRCTVFYQSDADGGLWRTEQKFAFEKTVELPDAQYVEGPARLWGETEYCNCRAVSEHRIDLRGACILCAAAMTVQNCELLTSLADCGIEQRTRTLQGLTRAAAEEKTLTAEGTLPLPAAGEVVLQIGGRFAPDGCTVQTGQVNVAGTLQMQAVCRPANGGETAVRQKGLPVRQTLELTGAAEGDDCIVWGEVLSCTLTEGESGEGALAVTWKLHAELWRSVQRTVVADAYSTVCETQTVQTVCRLLQKTADLTGRAAVTAEDDLPDADTVVLGCFVTPGALLPLPADCEKDGGLRLQGKGVAHVLCADAHGELTCYDKAFTWQPDTACAPAAAEGWLCAHTDTVRAAAVKSGARLRIEAELAVTGALFQPSSTAALRDVEPGEAFADKADGPALYLYYAQEGERVFDIAKRYHARAKDLAAANGLDADGGAPQELTTGAACLLIPAAL